jgi:hypothetical protein
MVRVRAASPWSGRRWREPLRLAAFLERSPDLALVALGGAGRLAVEVAGGVDGRVGRGPGAGGRTGISTPNFLAWGLQRQTFCHYTKIFVLLIY